MCIRDRDRAQPGQRDDPGEAGEERGNDRQLASTGATHGGQPGERDEYDEQDQSRRAPPAREQPDPGTQHDGHQDDCRDEDRFVGGAQGRDCLLYTSRCV